MTILGTIKQFNWLDIFVVIILLRIGYIALKNGLGIELFKILGTLLAIYLAMHYYTVWADFIRARLGQKTPLKFLDFLCFLVLVILGQLVFILLRNIFWRFIKMEATPNLSKWGGLILGIARAGLLISLLIFILVISSLGYLKNSVRDSYSGRRLIKIAPFTYAILWNNLMSKFMTAEVFNKSVLSVPEELAKK